MSFPVSNLTAANVQDIVSSTMLPTTFHGDAFLYGSSLASMTAFTCLGVMVAGWMMISMVVHRKVDLLFHPVTIYRASWFFAAMALTLRAGAAGASLWAWDPKAAKTAATVLTAQRYIDHASLVFAGGWLLLLALTYPAMVSQLRKRPYPVVMLERLPELRVPLYVVAMSIVAAAAVAWLRSQSGLS